MSDQGEFFTYTRDEFLEEFVHPDDRAAVLDERDKRALQVRAEYLAEMRKKAGLTQAEVAGPEVWGGWGSNPGLADYESASGRFRSGRERSDLRE